MQVKVQIWPRTPNRVGDGINLRPFAGGEDCQVQIGSLALLIQQPNQQLQFGGVRKKNVPMN